MKQSFLIALLFTSISVSAQVQQSTIKVQPATSSKQLTMPWRNIIAVGRANNLLRADILEHLAYAQKVMGYRYCRFHAIFDDEMKVVQRNPETGKLVFQWHEVDQVYDALLKLGIKPFVELNPMPKAMASGTQTMF
ncbi:MAG: glycoside hydrolase, partial [Sphingobacteriales bacterium]